MSERSAHRDLGMDRRIPRRDFLNGVAIGITGALALNSRRAFASSASRIDTQPAAPGSLDPPARTGLRGNYPAAVRDFDAMQAGAYRQFPAVDVDTGENYDLAIVGGGISGLAAAHFWRRALGTGQKVLILDNHDDFGGHAKRHEFTYQGRTFVGYGGTMGIATPYPYSSSKSSAFRWSATPSSRIATRFRSSISVRGCSSTSNISARTESSLETAEFPGRNSSRRHRCRRPCERT